jgi:hypothetical protein
MFAPEAWNSSYVASIAGAKTQCTAGSIGVQGMRRFTTVVRDRVDANVLAVDDHTERLEHDRRAVAADDPEPLVLGLAPGT